MSQSRFEPSRSNKKDDDLDSILGDLSGLSELIDENPGHSVGDMPAVAEGSLLGDLSLLDEAEDSPPLSMSAADDAGDNLDDWGLDGLDGLDEQNASPDLDDDIPVLTESVDLDLPTQPALATANTVPLLDDEIDAPATQGVLEKDQFLLSELENIASQLSTPLADEESADMEAEAVDGLSIDMQEEALLQSMTNAPEMEEALTAESASSPEFNDSEYQHLVDALGDDAPAAEDVSLEDASTALSEAVSEFVNPEEGARAHSGVNNFTAELHTQLARQIDSLLVSAINSLSEELNHHLADRMEKLLLGAVDEAMPKLMEQLAQGLRKEVQSQVSDQLPHIVNEMLGKLGNSK